MSAEASRIIATVTVVGTASVASFAFVIGTAAVVDWMRLGSQAQHTCQFLESTLETSYTCLTHCLLHSVEAVIVAIDAKETAATTLVAAMWMVASAVVMAKQIVAAKWTVRAFRKVVITKPVGVGVEIGIAWSQNWKGRFRIQKKCQLLAVKNRS